MRTEGALAQNRALLDAIPDPAEELGAIATRLQAQGAEIELASAEAIRLREAVAGLRQKQAESAAAIQRMNNLRTDIEYAEAAAATIAQRIADTHALEERSAEICAGARDLEIARTAMDRLQAARTEYDNSATGAANCKPR